MPERVYDDKHFYCEHCSGAFKTKNPAALARHVAEKHGERNGRETAKAAKTMRNMNKVPRRYR